MSEAYAWPDGRVYMWTGGAGATSASGLYATDTQMREIHGAVNIQNVSGVYRDVPTGRRVDVTIGVLYSLDTLTLQKFAAAETAVHMHLVHNDALTSAGMFLWSGYVDGIEIAGRERDLYRARLTYHANIWSAY